MTAADRHVAAILAREEGRLGEARAAAQRYGMGSLTEDQLATLSRLGGPAWRDRVVVEMRRRQS